MDRIDLGGKRTSHILLLVSSQLYVFLVGCEDINLGKMLIVRNLIGYNGAVDWIV